jgi:AcrR family transcriptional regulator
MPPKTRLERAAVIQAAADLADAEGLEQLTLARLAEHLGIQTPSLYNHLAGLAGLRRDLALLGIDKLNARLTRAVIGKVGNAAVEALAHAYRAFAKEHPGLYAATIRAPDPADEEAKQAAQGVVAVIVAVLAAYGLRGDEAIHAIRVLRSALDGFVMLETTGGFGMPLDLDETFRRLIQIMIRGFQQG